MIQSVYSVKDLVANDFNGVFLAKNNAVAVRAFKAGKDNPNFRFQDYQLYKVGTWSDESGWLQSCDPELVNLSEYEVD